jgi:hypothetical protein
VFHKADSSSFPENPEKEEVCTKQALAGFSAADERIYQVLAILLPISGLPHTLFLSVPSCAANADGGRHLPAVGMQTQ